MKQQTPDQNQLALLLHDKLQTTTEKFVREHRNINIQGFIGAGNAYLAAWFTCAKSKEVALKALEENFEIIRNLVKVTPDNFFGSNRNNINFN